MNDSQANLDDLLARAMRICRPQRYRASGGGDGVTITGTVGDKTLRTSVRSDWHLTYKSALQDDNSATRKSV